MDAFDGTPNLAYEVITGGTQKDGTPSRLATYVDASTGQVLRTEQQIETVDGSGQSLYGGTVPLQVTPSGSTYELRDPTRGGTYTTDMDNQEDSLPCQILGTGCATGTVFSGPDTSFGTGATSSRESAAVDAQYGTNVTWDYYNNVHGRNGIFGTGQGSFNRVHYGNAYVNAFWDGTKMTYGDGDGSSYGPLTSLDVAGHEMSHGVTEHSANLAYSGEPGGLNEATSDIFGTAVEFYANNPNDPGDYLIGEQFDLTQHQGIRRMDKPSSDGGSADCWSPTVGQLDVHYSSGVGNHFFYLLSEGSGAKTLNGVSYDSPTCNGAPARDRHRSRRRGEDLVPRADGLHDVLDRLPRCAHRLAERRPGPVRRRQRAVQRRERRLGGRRRRLIPPPFCRPPATLRGRAALVFRGRRGSLECGSAQARRTSTATSSSASTSPATRPSAISPRLCRWLSWSRPTSQSRPSVRSVPRRSTRPSV